MLKFMLLLAVSLTGFSLRGDTRTPDWAKDVVWYQIFPERFANGDSSNDPTRESLGDPKRVPESWSIMDWTADWYARADWEIASGQNFYRTVYQRRYGGDLQGVINRLDYLVELGITGIYFNPLFYANSLHKYDGNSFHHIDPHFGPDPEGDLEIIKNEKGALASDWKWTAADKLFLELLKEAKARNIRVIIDGVWNHTGRDFFAFKDVRQKSRRSRYANWYELIAFDDPDTAYDELAYRGWHGHKSLPEFADDPSDTNLAAGPKQYVYQATKRWMDPNGDGDPSDGIDGWRLDVAEEMPSGFWQEWHALVREINSEAFTSAEIWKFSAPFLAETHFGSAMNYAGFAFPVKGWLVDNQITVDEFVQRLRQERESREMDSALILQNLVDSHDTQRVASMIANRRKQGDYENRNTFDYDQRHKVHARNPDYNIDAPDAEGRRLWKMLAVFQATYLGAPMIYYGTEAGMWGADDPDDRMPMWWPDLSFEEQTLRPDGSKRPTPQPAGFDREIFKTYQAVLSLRAKHAPLRRGTLAIVHTDNDQNLLLFERSHQDERVIVAINRGEKQVALKHPELSNSQLLYTTDKANTQEEISALSASIFEIKSE